MQKNLYIVDGKPKSLTQSEAWNLGLNIRDSVTVKEALAAAKQDKQNRINLADKFKKKKR